MTPTRPIAAPHLPRPAGRRRRVKRGIVAAYIHEISARHGEASPTAVVTPAQPITAAPMSAPV
jgi:hypothetical protein